MELLPVLLQFGGSLIAIVTLAWLARRLGLGPDPKLASEEEARDAAEAAAPGFHPIALSLDREGQAALLRDAAGRVLLLRPHGAHFAGRLLTPLAQARIEGDDLIVDTAEMRYGAARLRLDDASVWTKAIDALKEARHA